MTVEILCSAGCPHAASALALVASCLAHLALSVPLEHREGPYPSPTIKVNGRDVMGEPPDYAPCCRLDWPTEDRVMRALENAMRADEP
jgi:hypothetical protein